MPIFRKLLAYMHTKTYVNRQVPAYEHLHLKPSRLYKTNCLSQLAWVPVPDLVSGFVCKTTSHYHSITDMRSIRRDYHRQIRERELSELSLELPNRRPVSHYGPSSESSDSDSDNNSTSVPTRTQVPEDVPSRHDEQCHAHTTEKEEAVTAPGPYSQEEIQFAEDPFFGIPGQNISALHT
jgi:hypothetical protein